MSLRTRFALAFALVAAVVSAMVGVLSYHAACDRIIAEIDQSLHDVTAALADGRHQTAADPAVAQRPRREAHGGDEGRGLLAQAVARDGTVTPLGGQSAALPVSGITRALAVSGVTGQTDTAEVVVGGHAYRLLTTALGGDRGALQVAVRFDRANRVFGAMARDIKAVSLAVMLAAGAAGWLLARRITSRLVRLTRAAEQVSLDGAVDREVPVDGRDEVGRLSASFNTMLGRLAAARQAQERLVQDAAHELRTPLTSLRTNAGVLRRLDELSPDARARLLDDLEGEARELSGLVDELVELALSGAGDEAEEPVELAAAAARAARRVQRRTGREIKIDADGRVVHGRRQSLERAMGNLLENAAKFDADGLEPIELLIDRGAVTVLDRGPGIGADDAARVFDRFYRAGTARGLPGSGLGLSIVRDVAEFHGGTVFAGTRPGGGAAVGFTVDGSRLM